MGAWAAEEQRAVLERSRSSSASVRAMAFGELFEAMRAHVFGVCFHLTGSRNDAEDAVQDCFLDVHQALPSFRGESLLSTWVYRIALRSAWRVKARRRNSGEPLDVGPDVASTDAGPDEVFATHERATRLRAAFDDLSEEQRTVLSLFAVDGLGHKEIADVLGVPEGTIWSRLHTARKRLAASMAEKEA